jgi:hypothetical protein
MILYNVTVNVAPDVDQVWVQWMKEDHIPKVLATKRFVEHKFFKLLTEHPDAEGNTYAIQYFAENQEDLDAYLSNEAPALQKEHVDRYGEKCLAFRTVLEEV